MFTRSAGLARQADRGWTGCTAANGRALRRMRVILLKIAKTDDELSGNIARMTANAQEDMRTCKSLCSAPTTEETEENTGTLVKEIVMPIAKKVKLAVK